jgi:hypothetical protein
MTYTGVLATIFTGIEPAVALSLACVPFLRPLIRSRNNASTGSDSQYARSSKGISKGSSGSRGAFKALDDDSSEIQLQPLGSDSLKYEAEVSPGGRGEEPPVASTESAGAIFVKKDWDVVTGRRPGS